MGQNSLNSNSELAFEASHWIEAIEDAQTTRFPNVNPYRKRLLMNKITSELVEEYEIQFFSHSDYNGFLSEVELRKDNKSSQKLAIHQSHNDNIRNCPYIYKVRHFRALEVQEMCTTIYNGLLYIDKVEVRLKEVNDIPYADQLYLYKACLLGFKALYETVGVFEITEQMIFFDQQGCAKVWVNPNLSKFQPNYQPEYYNNVNYIESQGSQSEMIRNLINIIQNNTDKQSIERYLSFRDYLRQKCLIDRLSFSKTIDYFDNYLKQENITPNRYMHSIYELYHYDEQKEKESRESSQVDVVHFKRSSKNSGIFTNTVGQRQTANRQNHKQKDKFSQMDKSIGSRNGSQKQFLTFRNDSRAVETNIQSKMNNVYLSNDSTNINRNRERANNANQLFQRQASNQPKKEGAYNQLRAQVNVRSALTFNPHQLQNQNNFSRVNYQVSPPPQSQAYPFQKYRSLDKTQNFSFGGNNKNITFSYQKQGPAIKTYKQNKSVEKMEVRPIIADKSRPNASIIDKLIIPNTGNTIKSIDSASTIKGGQGPQNSTSNEVRLNYYTSNCEYLLDQEIAEDMIKYLSFNPNS